jgi:hypothetical protein
MLLAVTTCVQFIPHYGFHHPLDAARHQLLCAPNYIMHTGLLVDLVGVWYMICDEVYTLPGELILNVESNEVVFLKLGEIFSKFEVPIISQAQIWQERRIQMPIAFSP